MRISTRLLALAVLGALAAGARAQNAPREPSVGFLFPAGGRQGTTVRIVAGGQNLRGANGALISGPGVRVVSVRGIEPAKPLTPEQTRELGRRLAAARNRLLVDIYGAGGGGRTALREPPKEEGKEPVTLPDHPLINKIDRLNLKALKKVADEFFDPARRLQVNRQIAERVEVVLEIEPGAEPGDREMRLLTALGPTNPMLFTVGALPEVLEDEPNDAGTCDAAPLDLPFVLNGQVSVKDADRVRFRARQGQRLVFAAEARRLIPYLADAVPGWFQATLTLYDAAGALLSFADDYRTQPDPVLFFDVPRDGEYELEIGDALYRGRDDFVYRLTAGELPWITSLFPLGGRAGGAVPAAVAGANLPFAQVQLDTIGGEGIRRTAFRHEGHLTNAVSYAADSLPECLEVEPNDAPEQARRFAPPVIVNGRVDRPGDEDVFLVQGLAGDEIVAEVMARRLDSPLDSLLRITDGSGAVIALNDDSPDRAAGLVTHQADSYVALRLPADGTYGVHLSDAQGHGGTEYAYRLRLSPPRPDFALLVTPSSLAVPAGGIEPVTVHVVRRDGFAGDILLGLDGAPPGFALSGARLPPGREQVRVTLTAPAGPARGPAPLRIVGRAQAGGRAIERPVIPADDRMQAFGYRHLVPALDLLVSVSGTRRPIPTVSLLADGPYRLPLGGTVRVRVLTPDARALPTLEFSLSDPPKGVSLRDVATLPDGLLLVFAADAAAAVIGCRDNLIVEASTEAGGGGGPEGKGAARRERAIAGYLPAIPIEVVAP